MKKPMGKTEKRIWGIIFGGILLVLIMSLFPVIHFGDRFIFTFGPDRIGSGGRGFYTRVFGSHVLGTEYGEIRLRNFARIFSVDGTVAIVRTRTFERGRASHNLVVEGMIMPQNMDVIFNPNEQLIILILDRAAGQERPEIIISGIPVRGQRIYFNTTNRQQQGGDADIRMLFLSSGYITLADDTQIYLAPLRDGRPSLHGLHIHREDELWRIIRAGPGMTSVKRHGETEFAEYRSVIFRPHWGEFIEGVRVE